jgi:DNA-binding MarR family transcriptional regulator
MNNELYEKLTRLQWQLHKQQMRGWASGGPTADATRGQGRILAFLKLRDGVSTKDLSYLLGMAVSSLNEMLSKLEKGGYITRKPSEQDKRIILVKLTDKGKTEEQADTPDIGDMFACLSEEEQKVLGDYLDRINNVLKEKFGEIDNDAFERMKAAHERFDHDNHDLHGHDGHAHGLGYSGNHGPQNDND